MTNENEQPDIREEGDRTAASHTVAQDDQKIPGHQPDNVETETRTLRMGRGQR